MMASRCGADLTPVIPAAAGIQRTNLGDGSEPSTWIPGRAALARNDGILSRGKLAA